MFELLFVGALVKLRLNTEMREKKTFRTPLYPLPLVFVVFLASYKMYNNLVWRTVPSVVGLVLSVASFPLYHFLVKRRRHRRMLESVVEQQQESAAVSLVPVCDAAAGNPIESGAGS